MEFERSSHRPRSSRRPGSGLGVDEPVGMVDSRRVDTSDYQRAAVETEMHDGFGDHAENDAGVFKRTGRVTLGVVVVIVGIIALPLPGPGTLIIAAGLVILRKDVPIADRILKAMRKRAPGIPDDGKIPLKTLLTSGLFALIFVGISLFLFVL